MCHVGRGICGIGHTFATPALVKQRDLQNLGIKPVVSAARFTAPRTTVDDQNGAAVRIAAGLPGHLIAVTNIEQPVVVHLRLAKHLVVAHAHTLVNGLETLAGQRGWNNRLAKKATKAESIPRPFSGHPEARST